MRSVRTTYADTHTDTASLNSLDLHSSNLLTENQDLMETIFRGSNYFAAVAHDHVVELHLSLLNIGLLLPLLHVTVAWG